MAQQEWPLKQKHYAILNYARIRVDPQNRFKPDQQRDLRKKLQDGLFFSNTLKYWASNSGKDCFALYARRLQITGSDDNSCWIWDQDQDQETEDRKVEEQKMLNVPLNVKLVLPDGSKQETQRSVSSLDKWERLLVGTFRTAYNTIGMLDISLQQVDDKWKERIVIKCVEIVAQD
ncbi:hypothetical protein CRG98_035801 [Punica granatum]|uniref:Uncharacterized protein n=1 Tax=Punica granatum TaxID=22663 RepID=A0A2I0IJB3_PUNGR|nr:hypothetical protein CRG98_035801 [Punica granatum]